MTASSPETAQVYSQGARSAQEAVVASARSSVQELYDLSGRFAVVTGGARGLGLTIAGECLFSFP